MNIDESKILTIQNVEKNDSGIYSCRGSNMLGDTVASINLKVGTSCKEKPVPPIHHEFIPGKSIELSAEIEVSNLFNT